MYTYMYRETKRRIRMKGNPDLKFRTCRVVLLLREDTDQSILALSKVLTGLLRLLARRILEGALYLLLACLRSFLRATMTGTEDLVTR
jgi:hypothetical protein